MVKEDSDKYSNTRYKPSRPFPRLSRATRDMRKDEVSQYNRLDSASLKPIHDHFPRIQINPTVSTSQFLVTSPGPWTVVNILGKVVITPNKMVIGIGGRGATSEISMLFSSADCAV